MNEISEIFYLTFFFFFCPTSFGRKAEGYCSRLSIIRNEWCVAPDLISSRFLVPATSPTVLGRSF